LAWRRRIWRPENGVCLFPKGPGVEVELTVASALWHMEVERFFPPGGPGACILKVSRIRHVGQNQTPPADHRDRQPERRGGQNHHRHQPGRRTGRGGRKVLLMDFDPQGNASTGLGIDHAPPGRAYALLAGEWRWMRSPLRRKCRICRWCRRWRI
jgi:hypothetical protein